MKQTKHLRQALWRTLLCLTVLLGFATSGLAAESYRDLYLVGANFGSWNIDSKYKMSRDGNVYTITVDKLEGEWKIWDGTWSGSDWAYSFGAGSSQPAINANTDVWFNSSTNFKTTNAKKTTITLTLVSGSDVKNSSTPSKLKIENAPEMPAAFNIYGNLGEEAWGTMGMVRDEANNCFTLTNVKLENPKGGGYAWFRFKDGNNTEYGAPNNDFTPQLNTSYSLTSKSSNNFKIASGYYDVTVDFSGAKPTVTFAPANTVVSKFDYYIYHRGTDNWAENSQIKLQPVSGDPYSFYYEGAMTPSDLVCIRVFDKGAEAVTDNVKYWAFHSTDTSNDTQATYPEYKNKNKLGDRIADEEGTYGLFNIAAPLAADNKNINCFVLTATRGKTKIILKVDENGLPVNVTITPPSLSEGYDFYIHHQGISDGSGNTWNRPFQMTETTDVAGNTVYVLKHTFKAEDEFCVRVTKKGSTDELKLYKSNNGYQIPLGGANDIQLYEGGSSNFKMPRLEAFNTIYVYIDDEGLPVKMSVKVGEPILYLASNFYNKGAGVNNNMYEKPIELRKNDDGSYQPLRLVVAQDKYNGNENPMFRFTMRHENNGAFWLGPDNDSWLEGDLVIKDNNNKLPQITAKNTNQVYWLRKGEYILTVTNYDRQYDRNDSFEGGKVEFTLERVGDIDHKPYYLVGDMNDWFSEEFFTDPSSKGANSTKFRYENKEWQFKYLDNTYKSEKPLPEGVNLNQGWYVFETPLLSGQFQITDGGTHNLWDSAIAEVYSHTNTVKTDNNSTVESTYDPYIQNPISRDEIENAKSLSAKMKKANGSNFHMDCNAVKDARIFFKPGDKPDMRIEGTPQNYFVFYGCKPSDETDDGKVVARIQSGKPNTNNYYLPGITYSGYELPPYPASGDGYKGHMNTTSTINGETVNGVELVEFKIPNWTELETDADAKNKFKNDLLALGMSDDDATNIVNYHTLPNGTDISDWEYLYLTKIPNGFEDPAGWKYNMKLTKARKASDKQRSVVIACSHVYFMPVSNIAGVCVHVDPTSMQKVYDLFLENKYADDEDKDKIKGLEYEFWYRVYYSDTQNGVYVIKSIDHTVNNQIEEEKVLYRSNEGRLDTAKEIGDKRNFGWKKLDTKISVEDWTLAVEEKELSDAAESWQVAWFPDVTNKYNSEGRRLRIPNRYANSYIQLAVVAKKPGTRAKVIKSNVASDPFEGADFTWFMPKSVTFDNKDQSVYPLQGRHLYVQMKPQDWLVTTDVEDIENEMVTDIEGDFAPVYYNLQGVRVAEPTNGIFIEVRGNKSRKVTR